jgi:hypothetical protein
MDEKTRTSLARIAAEWKKSGALRVEEDADEEESGRVVNESTGMSPIALRHRRYAQLIQLRRRAE